MSEFPCIAYCDGDAQRALVARVKMLGDDRISFYFASYGTNGKEKFYAYMDLADAADFGQAVQDLATRPPEVAQVDGESQAKR